MSLKLPSQTRKKNVRRNLSTWLCSSTYLWIDLAAGTVDYGPALFGDGVLPRGEFHPLAALHGRPKSQRELLR
jgi:hypothetical protein